MYLKFINKDPDLPESWSNYFQEIGDELNIIVKEINGPSWSPLKKIDIDEIQKKIEKKKKIYLKKIRSNKRLNQKDNLDSNEDSIKAVAMIDLIDKEDT